MNNKGQVLGVIMVILLLAVVGIAGYAVYSLKTSPQSTVQTTTQSAQQVAQATKTGDVSSLNIYVRDLANNNINTKIAVATYCKDDLGQFILDGTSSSTSAEISAKTEIGRTVTCWAFNGTTVAVPQTIKIDGESPHIVLDAYNALGSGRGKLQFYTDTYATGSGGAVNVSVSAGGSGKFQKARFTVNSTDTVYPLGGFYFNRVASSNISDIDMSGSATLSGMTHASTQIVKSTLATAVTSRKDNWDFVFEIDDNSAEAGNQPLLMEENDYLESGAVVVSSNSGCTSAGELVSSYAFAKTYFRSNTKADVLFGHETDGTSPAVVLTDITGDTFYCTA